MSTLEHTRTAPRSIAPHQPLVTPAPIRTYRIPRHRPAGGAPRRRDPCLDPSDRLGFGSPCTASYVQDRLDLRFTAPQPPPHCLIPQKPPEPPAPVELPVTPVSPDLFAGRVAVKIVEVARGGRPLSTLTKHVSPSVMSSLERRRIRSRVNVRVRPVQLRRVVGTAPGTGVFDAAVVCEEDFLIHTLALRLRLANGRWVVTELLLD